MALRASFLIDRAGVVQHQVVNNLPLGREVDEMVRLVEALQFTEEHGEVCPAGWRKGQKGMKASAEGVASYLAENAEALWILMPGAKCARPTFPGATAPSKPSPCALVALFLFAPTLMSAGVRRDARYPPPRPSDHPRFRSRRLQRGCLRRARQPRRC